MWQHSYFQALILIQAAGTVILKRRQMEAMCSYPSEYGGDENLLKCIDTFLSDTEIQHDLAEATKFIKTLKEET